jgi:hypothetical protein
MGQGERRSGVASLLLSHKAMISLLAIMFLGLLVGKVARRITPAVELLLLLLIGGIVAAEYLSWSGSEGVSPADFLRSLITGY